MRDRKGIDVDVADLETLARADVLDAVDGRFPSRIFGILGVHFHDFAVRRLGQIRGAVPVARELRDGVGMVGMLVGDQDAVDAVGLLAAQRFESAQEFLAAEAGVNEEGGALGFEQRRVARAARGQNGYAERDTECLREKMMAKWRGGVKGKRKPRSHGGRTGLATDEH